MVRLWMVRCSALAALLFAGTGAGSAQSSFDRIPENAPIVVKLPGLDTATEKVGAFLDAALPDQSKKIKAQMKEGLEKGLQGRDTSGIVKTKPVYAFIANFENIEGDNPPNGGVLVPITKYADFKKVFTEDERKSIKTEDGLDVLKIEDHDVYLLDKGDYVFVSASKMVAKAQAGTLASLKGKLSADIEKSFADKDFCILVNMVQINELYGAQIKGAKSLVDLVIGQAGAQMDKKQLEMAKDIILGGFQVVEDSKAILIGISVKGEGVSFRMQSQFARDSETGSFLKDMKLGTLDTVASFPADKTTYTGLQLSAKMGKLMAKLSQQAMADDTNEDVKAKLAKASEALSAAGQQDQYTFSTLSPITGLTINKFENGEAALAAQMQLFSAMSETSTFSSVPLKSKPIIKEKAEQGGGLTFNMVQFQFDLDKVGDGQQIPDEAKEAMKKMMKKMMGDSQTTWLAVDGKSIVTVIAKDWTSGKKLAEQYAALKNGKAVDSLGASPAYKITRAGLPAEATLLTLMESNSLMSALYGYFKDLPQMIPGVDAASIPELKFDANAPKTFIGFSVSLKAEHGGFDFFVPSETIKQIAKIVKPLTNQGD